MAHANEPPQGRFEERSTQIQQLQLAVLVLFGFALSVYLLQQFATILQHVLIALFLAYLILPLHRWLMRLGVNRVLAYVAIVMLFVGCLSGLGFVIYENAQNAMDNLPKYRTELNRLIERVATHFPGLDAETLKELVREESQSLEATFRMGRAALGTLWGFLSEVFLVLVFLVFMLAEHATIPKRIHDAFEPARAEHILGVIKKINTSVSRYIAAKTFACVLTGGFTALTLYLFGVDNAVLWGFIAFLSHYIPYLGPLIAVTIPVLLSLPQFDNLWIPALLLFLLNAVQTAIGYFLEPILFGHRLALSPFVIIVSLSFWWSIWGIVGMILAVPLVAVFKIICENIAAMKPIASLLSRA